MDENTPNKNNFPIVWMLALIVVLFIAVKLIFVLLSVATPQEKTVQPDLSPAQSVVEALPAPSFCPYCGEKLPGGFQWGQFCPYCGTDVEAGET